MYSFEKHQRLEETQYLYGATIIIGTVDPVAPTANATHDAQTAEGIMALHDPELRKLYDLKVRNFLD